MGESELTEKDHWNRLRTLRRTGMVNMFTELRKGLQEMGWEETWEWLTENDDRMDEYLEGGWVEK